MGLWIKDMHLERCAPFLAWRSVTAPPEPKKSESSPAHAAPGVPPDTNCEWEVHKQKFLGGYAGKPKLVPYSEATRLCMTIGPKCLGITCDGEQSSAGCTPRLGNPFLLDTPDGDVEVSYVKKCKGSL